MNLTSKQLTALHNAKCDLFHTHAELSKLIRPDLLKGIKAAERVLAKIVDPHFAKEDSRLERIRKVAEKLPGSKHAVWSVGVYPHEEIIGAAPLVRFKYPTSMEDGTDYLSEVVAKPTFADAFRCFVEALHYTGDNHHVFFEGVELSKKKLDGAQLIELISGS